jgi:hypothetical protein
MHDARKQEIILSGIAAEYRYVSVARCSHCGEPLNPVRRDSKLADGNRLEDGWLLACSSCDAQLEVTFSVPGPMGFLFAGTRFHFQEDNKSAEGSHDSDDETKQAGEHWRELRKLMRPVPFLWIAASITIAIPNSAGAFERLCAASLYGLGLAYPVLGVQLLRFAKPGLEKKELALMAVCLTALPLTVVLGGFGCLSIDRLWSNLIVIYPQPGFPAMAAKATLAVPALVWLVLLHRARTMVESSALRILDLIVFALLIVPSFIAAALLMLLEISSFVWAVREASRVKRS